MSRSGSRPRTSGRPRTRSRPTTPPSGRAASRPRRASRPASPSRPAADRGTPRSRRARSGPPSLLGLDPEDAADLLDPRESAEHAHRLLERALAGAVGDEYELRVVAEPLLPHALDRDLAAAEDAGDLGQDAGAILDAKQDVVLARHLVHRADRPLVEARAAETPGTREQVPRDAHEIAHDGGRRGLPAGAAAVEHQLADARALDEDRVVGVAHRGERVRRRDHRGVDPDGDPLVVTDLRDREQLHHVAEAPSELDVLGGDVRDALA